MCRRATAPDNCTDVYLYSEHWPCLFPQHGPGKKHHRPIRLKPWQEDLVNQATEEFIRGLIDSDGCRVVANDRGVPRRYRQGVSTTRRRRPALIVLVIVAACACLALGWWQWTRFQEINGNFQNLGYALQWPLFAWFCVYAYRKFVRYEEAPPEPHRPDTVTEIPAGLLPERPARRHPDRRRRTARLQRLLGRAHRERPEEQEHRMTETPAQAAPPRRSAARCCPTGCWRGRPVSG